MWPSVDRFPETAAGARQAQSSNGDRSTALERKVATVATAAVTDPIRRGFVQSGPNVGRGLRGGKFEIEFTEDAAVAELRKARFARDVKVSGGATYAFPDEVLAADIEVRGPNGMRGQLRLVGEWFSFYNAHATSFRLRGKLDGDRIKLKVPAS